MTTPQRTTPQDLQDKNPQKTKDATFITNFFSHVEQSTPTYVSQLSEAVAIPSISSDLPTHYPDILHMIQWTQSHMTHLGGHTELYPNPLSTSTRPLPPLLLGHFPSPHPNAKTVCVYGHLDVQPAKRSDGWNTDPFILTERNGKLYGRGSTDDKGPALSWLWVLEAYQILNQPLPVSVKILYEGMEESGSEGMSEAIAAMSQKNQFLNNVDFFCISDNYWLGKTKPCLTYGLRGCSYFEVMVQCAVQDLHSGTMGGTVHEAMTDMVALMASLVESGTGKILVDGIMEQVVPVTVEEEKLYDSIDFDVEAYKEENQVTTVSNALLRDTKKEILMARWRYPSLSLHGIEGAFDGPGSKTVIPAKVIGKFSIRLVPNMEPKTVKMLVVKHLEREFQKLKSPNVLQVTECLGVRAWISDNKHPNYDAAARAIQKVYGTLPDYTREGGSIPITSFIEDATSMNVLLLPIGACDDMAHSQNEKYNMSNLVNGVKVLGLYLYELGKIRGPKPSLCRCELLTEEELMVPGAFMKGFRCKCEM